MLNIIRADLYRIFRGKGFYITLILLLAAVVLQSAASVKGMVGMVKTDESESVENIEDLFIMPVEYTGSTAPFEMMDITDNLLYFLLPIIIFIAAADFSTDSVKNVLSNGMPRIKYYLSKLILSCLFCILFLFIQLVFSIITATIMRGFGGMFDMDYAIRLLKPFSAQLFMCLSVTCVGIFFAFVTKRTAAVTGAYISFCMVPMLLIFIIYIINNDLEFLMKYDVILNIRMLANIDIAASSDIARAFALGGFYMLASTVGGILLFKRSEIR